MSKKPEPGTQENLKQKMQGVQERRQLTKILTQMQEEEKKRILEERKQRTPTWLQELGAEEKRRQQARKNIPLHEDIAPLIPKTRGLKRKKDSI